MIDSRLNYDDMIALESVESFMQKKGVRSTGYPIDSITQESVFKNELYSKIAERMPKYAVLILSSSDSENNDVIKGLTAALTQHVLHPEFIDILMKCLDERRDPDAGRAKAVVGALLVDIALNYVVSKRKELEASEDKKSKKDKTENGVTKETENLIDPARKAAYLLLGSLLKEVQNVCGDLKDHDALVVAGAIAMGGSGAITKLISMDLPITAEVYEIIRFDEPVFDSIIRAALLLRADKFTKLTDNQKNFIDSLKRWIYKSINDLNNPQKIYQLLLSTYGSAKPQKTEELLIQLKDAGTSYGYLYSVARQMFVSKD